MKERNQNIDAVRGTAAILVMFGHCIVLNQMQDGLIYDMIKSVQMPLFILVSGYLASKTKYIHTYQELGRLIKKRAAVCLIPFFTWILVLHPTTFLVSLRETMLQTDKGLWFLMVLFLFSFVQILARYGQCFLEKRKGILAGWIVFIVIWSIFGILLLAQIMSGNQFLSPHLSIYYLPFYLAGVLVKNVYDYIPDKFEIANRFLSIPIIILCLALLFFISLQYDMIQVTDKKILLLQLLASLSGSIGIILVVNKIKGKSKQLLSFVGQYTLEIYVIHYHFARILWQNTKPVTELGFEWFYRIMVSWIFMTILTTAVIWILKKIKIADILLFGQFYQYRFKKR